MLNVRLTRILDLYCLTEKVSETLLSNTDITNISLDSRQANSSTIFVALYGVLSNGHDYVDSAIKQDCPLVLLETDEEEENGELYEHSECTSVQIKIYKLQARLPQLAEAFYLDFINSDIFPILTAITGTNGKTSVANICAHLVAGLGKTSACIGTLGVQVFTHNTRTKLFDSPNTTPDILSLFNYLISLSALKCNYVFLEASSHGLEQKRMASLPIKYGVFTNLSQDHLDFHKTMDAYAQAKRRLLSQNGMQVLVLNADDPESKNWEANLSANQKHYFYSLQNLNKQQKGCWLESLSANNQGFDAKLVCKHNSHDNLQALSIPFSIPLLGQFNVSNALASVCVLLSQGFDLTSILKNLANVAGVAGRMELFRTKKASLIVDYAHTPDALKHALIAAKQHTLGRLICIFGCGGDRDKEKRPLMGKIAEQYANKIVLTQDNSRSELPREIVLDIKRGISKEKQDMDVVTELDREQAILKAWMTSSSKDTILLAGKGHEEYIEVQNKAYHYSERHLAANIATMGEKAKLHFTPSIWFASTEVQL